VARPVEVAKNSRFILLVTMCIVVAGLYFAREVLIPIALAILLTFLLTPPVAWLEKFKVPRIVATLLVVLIGVGIVGGLGYVVGKQLGATINDVHSYQAQLREKLQSFGRRDGMIQKVEGDLKSMAADGNAAGDGQAVHGVPPANRSFGEDTIAGQNPRPVQPTPESPLPVRAYPAPQTPFAMFRDYASSVFGPLANTALVIVFVIFMLLSREDLRDRLLRLLGHGRMNVTTQALDEASTRISNYLGALAIVNGCYGLCTAVGLWLIGKFLGGGQPFPNVMVWGLLLGVCRFIPYIGIFIGAGIPILLSFAIFPGNTVLLATFILFATLETIVSQFVEPMWYGSSTGMSALAVLVAAVFWAWLWGTIGLLLSTPLTVILVVMGKYVPQLKFLDILLREEAVLSPPQRFYQRLIALDQEEAADLAQEYLNEKQSLEAVYDDVLIPALSSATYDSHHERLSAEQLEFVRQSVRDIVDELAEQWHVSRDLSKEGMGKAQSLLSSAASTLTAAATTVATVASNVASAVTGGGKNDEEARSAKNDRTDAQGVRNFPRLPEGCSVNVLCLPSRDEVDEIVAIMLSQLLQTRGYCVSTPTADMLASEMVEMVERKNIDVIFVSAMPPAAVAHARYLCKRMHARYPDAAMAVGLWTLKGDLERARERISCDASVRIVTNLHDAFAQLDQLAQPAILQNTSRAAAVADAPQVAGHEPALT
jgi:predicted PurR-regulated permease PerM